MDARSEIERLTAKFAKALTERDFAVLGSFYEERGRFLPQGAPMAEGPAAIRATIEKLVKRGIKSVELHAVDVFEAGEFVVEIGRQTVVIQPPGALGLLLLLFGKRQLTKQGKSIVVWRKQRDGTFRIVADAFNSN